MPAKKTAISLDDALLARVDVAARELDLPRSRLLALAAEEFLLRRENREILDRLNREHAAGPTAEERKLAAAMRRRQRGRVEGEW